MSERDVRERDILVAPNEYAYVQDLTKGHIILYVGPTKISLSNTERMILLRDGRFLPVRGDEAGLGVLRFVEAKSSQYVVLENPPEDESAVPARGSNTAVPLLVGRKVVVPGPVEFPLWPGQRAQVVDGHRLRQDEYLVVRVYDDTFGDELPPIGNEIIVRGTEQSFYIPRSGLEVVQQEGRYVREAWRMYSNAALHLRVVAPFEASEADQLPAGRYVPGQDLFLHGRVGYFFPTEAIEVVGRVAAVPLAENEGIYVRSYDSGVVRIVEGPTSFLRDPRKDEILFRSVDPDTAALWGVTTDARGHAPAIYVPPSTAVMVVAKDRREVVIGPRTRLLGFDEDLEVLSLSTGRPKNDQSPVSTCFLRVDGNKVSDVVRVETSDHVGLEVHVSYRVSFVGEAQRWFNVKDYVGLLCDHLSSIIRATARTVPVERFHENGTGIVRDAVLGTRAEDGGREGRHFEENGMWVYDVEVLAVAILDLEVAGLLGEAQRMAIDSEIARKKSQQRLGDERLAEEVSRAIYDAKITTLERRVAHEEAQREAKVAEARTKLALDEIETVKRADLDAEAFAARTRARLAAAEAEAALERSMLEARASSFREQMQALQPELLSTLRMLGNRALAAELSKNLSPLAILGGDSVADVAARLLDRLPLPLRAAGPQNAEEGLGGSVLAVLDPPSDEGAAE